MLNNFIYAQTKDLFLNALNAGNVLDEAIVFIEDTKEIWNHGHYFGGISGSGIDPEVLSGIETAIATLQSDKADKNELSNYAKKNELPSLDGYLTKTVADGLYATIAQYNTLNQTVGNIQTELSNKATKDELSTGLAGKLDNSAASGFVPTTRKVNGVALDKDITITATDPNAATKTELNSVNTDLQTFKSNVATTYATDKDVADAISALVDSSPETLNTLNELSAALGDDPNFATTVATNIGKKADQSALDTTNTNLANVDAKFANYLPKAGGTIDGDIKINSIDGTPALIYFSVANSGRGALGCVAAGPVYYDVNNNGHDLLHSGNVGDYALKTYGTDMPSNIVNHVGFGKTTHSWKTTGAALSFGLDSYYAQIQVDYESGDIFTRNYNAGTFGSWKQIAFTDSNVAGAYKLVTSAGADAVTIGSNGLELHSGFIGYKDGDTLRYFGVQGSQKKLRFYDSTEWKDIAFIDSNVASAQALTHSNGTVGVTVDAYGGVCLSQRGILSANGGLVLFDFDNTHLNVGYSMRNSYQTDIYGNTIRFMIGDTSRMLINSSGNITIGNTDYAGTNAKLYVSAATGDGKPALMIDSSTSLQWNYLASFLAKNTDVDAGTSISIGKAHSTYNSGLITFRYKGINSSNYLSLHLYGKDDILNIMGSGNVLIGTTTDAGYKLDVAGSFNATSGYIGGKTILHSGNLTSTGGASAYTHKHSISFGSTEAKDKTTTGDRKVAVASSGHTHSVSGTTSGASAYSHSHGASGSFTGSNNTTSAPADASTTNDKKVAVGSSGHTHSFSGATTSSSGKSHSHSFTPAGSVSSSFSGTAGTTGNNSASTSVATAAHTHSVSGTVGNGGASHTHTVNGTTASGGASHTHTYDKLEITFDAGNGMMFFEYTSTASGSTTASHTHTMNFASGATTATHNHTFSSGSAAATADNTTNRVSVAAHTHTHSFTPAGSVSSSFSGTVGTTGSTGTDHTHTVGATTSGPSATTEVASTAHKHTVTPSGSVSVTVNNGGVDHTHTWSDTSDGPSATTEVASLSHAHTISGNTGDGGVDHTHTISPK